MNANQWGQVKNIVFRWVRDHPEPSMDQCLASWLGVLSEYRVRNLRKQKGNDMQNLYFLSE